MKLILHIGTVKTGTTTAQAWLGQNREVLSANGIWYPTSFLAVDVRSERISHPFVVDIVLAPEFFRKNALRAFTAEFESRRRGGCKVCVMSFEDLHFKLSSGEVVAHLADFLKSYFDTVQVVLYLRPQIDTAVSFASTASRIGIEINKRWFYGQARNRPIFDYNAAVERWESAFGRENVRCFSYKRDLPFADYIFEQYSIDRTTLKAIENQNISIGSNIIALANVLQIPFIFSDSLVHNLPRSAPISVGIELARMFQGQFEDSNAELTSRRDDIRMEDLGPDWHRYEKPENLESLEQACVYSAELRAMVWLLSGQLSLERARNALMMSEIARERQQTTAMITLANQALTEVRGAMRVEVFKAEAQRIQELATALAASPSADVSSV